MGVGEVRAWIDHVTIHAVMDPMATMMAALLRDARRLEVAEIPVPDPGPGETLMRMRACGICGSDLRYYVGENPWAMHTLGEHRPNPPDMVLGHELAGEVEAHSARFRASALAFRACGECVPCRKGREGLCANTKHIGHSAGWGGASHNPGGMAEACVVWSDMLYRLPGNVSFEEATFLDGLGVAVNAVGRGAVGIGSSVAVIGAGPIGLCIMQVARTAGARLVICSDVYEKALDVATVLGADVTVHDAQEDVVARAKRETEGEGMDVVFETAGRHDTRRQALQMLARGGTAVLLADLASEPELPTIALAGERTVTTSANNHYEDFQTGLDLLAAGRVSVRPIITHRFPLAEVAEAFDVALHKREHGALKVIIQP